MTHEGNREKSRHTPVLLTLQKALYVLSLARKHRMRSYVSKVGNGHSMHTGINKLANRHLAHTSRGYR